jgi:hypothetical protein
MVNKPSSNKNSKYSAYLKYSGLAFQLAFVVFIGIYAGKYLDGVLGFKKPIATMLLILILFSAYMYKIYKELTDSK